MAKKGLSRVQIAARRDLVDALDCIAVRASDILKMIQDKGYLIGYDNPNAVIQKDLRFVRERRKELLLHGDVEQAKVEFIAQQREILAKTLANKRYGNAIEASKNILKARGFNVDKFEGDLNISGKITFADFAKMAAEGLEREKHNELEN